MFRMCQSQEVNIATTTTQSTQNLIKMTFVVVVTALSLQVVLIVECEKYKKKVKKIIQAEKKVVNFNLLFK
jgi:GDP-D-mannose dehydratase